MTEKELLEQRYSIILKELNNHTNSLHQIENEFKEFVNNKIGTDEFYNEAYGMLSKMNKQKSLTDDKRKDVLEMKSYIDKLS